MTVEVSPVLGLAPGASPEEIEERFAACAAAERLLVQDRARELSTSLVAATQEAAAAYQRELADLDAQHRGRLVSAGGVPLPGVNVVDRARLRVLALEAHRAKLRRVQVEHDQRATEIAEATRKVLRQAEEEREQAYSTLGLSPPDEVGGQPRKMSRSERRRRLRSVPLQGGSSR